MKIPTRLLGVFPNPYPVWYSLFRGGVGFIELGFAFWMIQTYRHQGVWAMKHFDKWQKSEYFLRFWWPIYSVSALPCFSVLTSEYAIL
jgi:hypothetical protein